LTIFAPGAAFRSTLPPKSSKQLQTRNACAFRVKRGISIAVFDGMRRLPGSTRLATIALALFAATAVHALLADPACAAPSAAATAAPLLPNIVVSTAEPPEGGMLSAPLQILLLLTVLSIIPGILMMTTCFTRIVVVLSFLRQALGTQQLPPNQLILGLALILTVFTMTPVWSRVKTEAIDPWQRQEISQADAMTRAAKPLREFMLKQTREKDLALFVSLSKREKPKSVDEVPTSVIIPSFVISELRSAFQMGFVLYLPFLVIDIVIASVLMSMGMMMLPPVLISLPFKVLLFVLVDGWYLVVRSLVVAFQ
jgi:flagellar biosynthetic protein FliP